MKKSTSKLFALMIAVILIVSLLPTMAFAAVQDPTALMDVKSEGADTLGEMEYAYEIPFTVTTRVPDFFKELIEVAEDGTVSFPTNNAYEVHVKGTNCFMPYGAAQVVKSVTINGKEIPRQNAKRQNYWTSSYYDPQDEAYHYSSEFGLCIHRMLAENLITPEDLNGDIVITTSMAVFKKAPVGGKVNIDAWSQWNILMPDNSRIIGESVHDYMNGGVVVAGNTSPVSVDLKVNGQDELNPYYKPGDVLPMVLTTNFPAAYGGMVEDLGDGKYQMPTEVFTMKLKSPGKVLYGEGAAKTISVAINGKEVPSGSWSANWSLGWDDGQLEGNIYNGMSLNMKVGSMLNNGVITPEDLAGPVVVTFNMTIWDKNTSSFGLPANGTPVEIDCWAQWSGTTPGKTDYSAHEILGNSFINTDEKASLPSIQKWIVDNGNNVNSAAAVGGDVVSFKLSSTVPENMLNYILPNPAEPPVIEGFSFNDEQNTGVYHFAFHDVLPAGLTLDESSIKLQLNNNKNAIYDVDDEEFTVTVAHNDDGTTSLDVQFDLGKFYKDGDFKKEDFGIAPIELTYTATVNSSAAAGHYVNTAWVEYEDGETVKDTATVEIYGLAVYKFDQEDSAKGLAGAEFEVKDSEGNVVATLVSGEDGYAYCAGLRPGSYTLVETKAPEGYVKSDEPLTIQIPNTCGDDNIAVVRFANAQVPHTGGTGTAMFTTAGILIICAAALLFLASRKKTYAE